MTKGKQMRTLIGLVAACALSLVLAAPASAVIFTVNDLDDVDDAAIDGSCDAIGPDTCTLRAALEEANATSVGSDTINVSVAGTINLDSVNGALGISQVSVLNGNAGGTIIDAGGTNRVLSVSSSSVTLNDLRLEDGAVQNAEGAGIDSVATSLTLNRVTVADNLLDATAGGFAGAGIHSSGTLVLNDSTVSGNTVIGLSGGGGGIAADGPLTVNRSTISGNTTTLDINGRGGGIRIGGGAFALNISNSTISGNSSGGDTFGGGGGGGVSGTNLTDTSIVGSTIAGNTTLGFGGGVRLPETGPISENTIYAGNTDAFGNTNCGIAGFAVPENNIDTGQSCGLGTSDGNQENVSAGVLGLGALASNGGPTQTRSVAPGSVAQNAASADCGGLAVDQRGTARPQGASCDIGAFEQVAALTPPGTGGGSTTTATTPTTPVTPTAPAPPKCKKGQKLKKGKCVKKKAKKK